jgi:NhaP-type Na+/H+ or K+/H+ antiporter
VPSARLELVVVLDAAVLVCGVLARRLRVAPPMLQLACGTLLGFAPALRQVHLPPQVVLLLFLPALLYWESLTTSLREIRSNLRAIVTPAAASAPQALSRHRVPCRLPRPAAPGVRTRAAAQVSP